MTARGKTGPWGVVIAVAASLLIGMLAGPPVDAVEPDEILQDRQLEQRARRLSAELRCLVCQNQSIDDSNAPLARDLRLLVRERLTAGDSDQAVRDYIVARYGEFVLLRPPLAAHTLMLWLSPLLFLIGGVVLARAVMRRTQAAAARGGGPAAALSDDEQARLDALLKDDERD